MKRNHVLLAITMALPVVSGAQEVLSVEASRPLQEAVSILERRYGLRIPYEEAPYTDSRDLVDKTSPAYRGPWRAIDPRAGRIEVSYPVSSLTGKPDSLRALLQMLIDDHARRGNPGRFEVKTAGDFDFVVPVGGSVLDVPITLPEKQRSYDEAFQEILQAVSRTTGIRVKGGAAMDQPTFDRFSFGAKSEPARKVLLRLFEMRKGYLSCWHLLYGPNWGYFLNTHASRSEPPPPPPKRYVMKEVKLPDGTKGVVRVPVP